VKRGVRGVSSAISALVGGLIPRASESSRFSLSRLGLPQAAMTQQQNYNYDLNVRPTERWGAGVEYHFQEFNEPYAPS